MADKPKRLSEDDLIERLDRWSMPEPNSGCQLWLGACNRAGYGVTSRGGRSMLAHRASYEVNRGSIPAGLRVCHRCDNPGCINPNHLFLGTDADNSRDRVAKGRQNRGEKRWNAKLNAERVREIRASALGHRQLGRELGIDEALVRQVRRGQIWRHVNG